MKKTLALALLLGAPLAAQSFEVGLFVGQQQYPSPHMDVAPGTTLNVEADNKTVVGARFGYSVVDFGPVLLQLTAGYQPESKSTLKATLAGTPMGESELKQSHWSAGAMFNFKAVIAVGAGLEFRSESLKESGGDSTTYNRVWARVNAGYAFPTPLVKPFIGIEAAFPLSSKSNDFASAADLLKSLAPKSQIGIYAGIRF
ncbi:hypothetical protein [Geothrix sp. SG200]|uniref:hypothetical protein n=1 Tax=Geothrix sp. SG200 TaxID=2922865 RepID=UPI001FAB49E3|nr:hypothetical protein [Geothrix sp. SG200]